MMTLEQSVFYVFSAWLVISALSMILTRNPVRAVLYLVMAFFATAGLWILLEAEFLALILVLVYVGAVMTLFLFVVMMLNLDLSPDREGFVKYLPIGVLTLAMMLSVLIYIEGPERFGIADIPAPTHESAQYSNINELGNVLYTTYVYPFELAAVLLLVAIIAAITLSLRRPRAKHQNIPKQLRADPKDRVRLVKMKSEKMQRGLP